MEKSGFTNSNIKLTFEEKALEKLINDYAREAGMRNLERLMKKICEKMAFRIYKT